MNIEVRLYEQRFVPTLPYNQGPRVNNFVYLTSAFFFFFGESALAAYINFVQSNVLFSGLQNRRYSSRAGTPEHGNSA